MKRSQINAKIRLLERLAEREGFRLPPFLGWTPEEWQGKGAEYDEIRETRLGWDVTDYGMGDYDSCGIALITLRNGSANHKRYPKPYTEKLLCLQENQISLLHFHWNKMEDIINRGGGNLIVKLYNATRDNRQDTDNVAVHLDGRRFQVPAGYELRLTPGESVTIYPYCFHEFRTEPGTGEVLLGEVSMHNDDEHDNCYLKPCSRFPVIEEDELPYRLLCMEYPPATP